MRTRIALLCCLLTAATRLFSQDDEPEKIFAERIFIHTDKNVFVAGETIWFAVYVFNGNLPGSFSTNFYIDLLNEKSEIIASKKLPLFSGVANGDFLLPDSLPQDYYFLRAYTRNYLEESSSTGIIKPVAVLNPAHVPVKYRHQYKADYNLEFFPEGGTFTEDISNIVAFKATDQFGNAAKVKGILLSQNGDTLLHFNETFTGTGMFSINPGRNNRCYAKVIFNDTVEKVFNLPVAAKEGLILNLAENKKGKLFYVQHSENFSSETEPELVGYMFNRIVFREKLKFTDNVAQGLIPYQGLSAGLLNLVIIDKENKQLAGRNVFIPGEKMTVLPAIGLDTVGISQKSLNVFTIALPDSTEGVFSVSVTAQNLAFEMPGNTKLSEGILLENKIAPEHVFSSESKPDEATKTDLWLMTAERNPVKEIIEKNGVAENYLKVSGKMIRSDNNKPVSEWPVMFVVVTKDSTSEYITKKLNKDGSFVLDNLVFDDSARFYYQYLGKGAYKADIKLDSILPEPQPEKIPLSVLKNLPYQKLFIWDSLRRKQLIQQKDFFADASKYKLLEEVKVTVRKKRPVDILNKKYTSGLFSSMMNVRVIDLINEPPERLGQNIFDYLQGRVAGLTIDRRGGNYILTTNRAMSLSGGRIPVELFLNEMPADAMMLIGLTIDQIALVKYFPAGTNNMIGFGIAGKLAVYTKQPEDYKFGDSHSRVFFCKGYSPVKEFIHKDYTIDDKIKPDFRTTLYWNPAVLLNEEQREFKIRFYNSDNARKFKITVRGFTYDGRFIDFEKIIE